MGTGYNYNPGPYDYSKPAYVQPGPNASRIASEAQAGGRAHLYNNTGGGGGCGMAFLVIAGGIALPIAAIVGGLKLHEQKLAQEASQTAGVSPSVQQEMLNDAAVTDTPGEMQITTTTGQTVIARKPEAALRAERAQAVLSNPGSDYYNYEFRTAGPRAHELATMYSDFLHLVDASGSLYTTIAQAERLESWKRVAYGLLPEDNAYTAFCLVRSISALQRDVGLVQMLDPGHPLYTAGKSANPTYAQEIEAWDKSCAR